MVVYNASKDLRKILKDNAKVQHPTVTNTILWINALNVFHNFHLFPSLLLSVFRLPNLVDMLMRGENALDVEISCKLLVIIHAYIIRIIVCLIMRLMDSARNVYKDIITNLQQNNVNHCHLDALRPAITVVAKYVKKIS